MALKGIRCHIWMGKGCVLGDLPVLTHFLCLTALWDRYCDCPDFVTAKTEAHLYWEARGLLHHLRDDGIQMPGSWDPEFVFLTAIYLREWICVCLIENVIYTTAF